MLLLDIFPSKNILSVGFTFNTYEVKYTFPYFHAINNIFLLLFMNVTEINKGVLNFFKHTSMHVTFLWSTVRIASSKLIGHEA